ncbi:exodeoxyribonuclease VII small subunit [Georgenia alba]|uniref:Exodeoxyribonuclease 7 small subunit n=1 Tax=Georgenia alba TaxID=2233858 RepID=A0ABW2Q925_9MICO
MSQDVNGDVSELTYEQARDELIEIVQRLETGSTSLEDALRLWERGEALAARCQQWLDGARSRLDAARTGSTDAPEAPDGAAEREAALDDVAAALDTEEDEGR